MTCSYCDAPDDACGCVERWEVCYRCGGDPVAIFRHVNGALDVPLCSGCRTNGDAFVDESETYLAAMRFDAEDTDAEELPAAA